jgi:alkanesulfonate monooxygenase SsuD/methylene tetrahydromethanopterin reductase-like flavin-dependent oxidoreductase (luciferase family)
LATGIIILPLENPLRTAEDAAVLDALSGGRLELGFGTGGNEMVFAMFGRALDNRQSDYQQAFTIVRDAFAGKALTHGGAVLFPSAERLANSLWEATFSAAGARRIAQHGSGLLLARTTMPSPTSGGAARDDHRPLGDLQLPLVEAYLENWTSTEATPRIGLSRSIYVAETRAEALADADAGIRRFGRVLAQRMGLSREMTVNELLTNAHVHIGSPEDVVASLRADRLLSVATDLILQVHPVDPSHEKTLRSLNLIATEVAPALGWRAPHHRGEGELVQSQARSTT